MNDFNKMKTLLLVIIVIFFGCSNSVYKKPMKDETEFKYPSPKYFLKLTALQFADSANKLTPLDSLPKFVYNTNLDYLDSFLLTNGTYSGEYSSLRLEIFKYVNNLCFLDRIINTLYFKNQFDSINQNRKIGRFDYLSNYQLALLRTKEIIFQIDTLSKLQ